jgi:hypothetical protein
VWPSTSTRDGNIEQTCTLILDNRRVTLDEVANQLHISYGSAYGIITRDFTSMKFLQDWFRNNSRNSTVVTIWTSVTAIWSGIMKNVTLSTSHCHWRRNMGSPLWAGEQPADYGMATPDYHLFESLKNALKKAIVLLATMSWRKRNRCVGIQKLMQRWTKCVERQGHHVELCVVVLLIVTTTLT